MECVLTMYQVLFKCFPLIKLLNPRRRVVMLIIPVYREGIKHRPTGP